MGEWFNENATSLLPDVNEFKLDRAMENCFNWTPLHVAASRGQLELFQTLLDSNPELAEALDSQQRSLLHLASANGHIEIVKALIKVRPEMCLARDRDGANPLHVAAMRGKVEILDELFQANPLAAQARVEGGERDTILHLCVKYNQLEFLSNLLENHSKGMEFVNAKDDAGNTILHLAVAGRRFKIIEHVLSSTEICVNATNKIKQTAMDILLLGRKKGTEPEGVDKEIQALLENYHAKRAKHHMIMINHKQIAEKRNELIVAVVLMAILAFQIGVAPPGGVWQDDKNGHKIGGAVMASTYPILYALFLSYIIFGFISSIGLLVLIMTDLAFKTKGFLKLASITKGTTIGSIAITYLISLVVVSPAPALDQRTNTIVAVVLFMVSVTLALILTLAFIATIVHKKKSRNNAVERVNRSSLNNV